jgi:uncharacterized protein YbaR (Trm112 family)
LTYSRVRVDRTAIDVQVILRKHLRSFIDSSSRSIKDTSKHVLRHTELQTLACEFDFRLFTISTSIPFLLAMYAIPS